MWYLKLWAVFCTLLFLSLISGIARAGAAGAPPLPVRYVLLQDSSFHATWVQTERRVRGAHQALDIVNILVPEFRIRYLTQHDRGDLRVRLAREDELLITMAVLPELQSGRVQWVRIRLDTLDPTCKLSMRALVAEGYEKLIAYRRAGNPYMNYETRRDDVKPVVYRDGQYWTTPDDVLTEVYVVHSRRTWYPTEADNVTLNPQARVFTRADIQRDMQAAQTAGGEEAPELGLVLSSKLLLGKRTAARYEFWSFAPPIVDASLTYYGATEVAYEPGTGIVSAKYNEYFHLSAISPDNVFFTVKQRIKLPSVP
ncbi:hypothetical protein [Hymenobacter canadensis]|uniref:Uncharacterized protein n=1 Tax=Hymenobacter canadensis TaxID=2999067 RepID=A0ABY7LZJ2_9BACT|nr:hypothetical protein [Hymenobacter canadensis]WBA44175.1 hypothetical protein O3303_20015 [Hymenobacter canadensis]